MVIIGAAMNHWYHQDMNYRAVINMTILCAAASAFRAAAGRTTSDRRSCGRRPAGRLLAFALDWVRPPRHMNRTSFFYAHSDQWRYEKLARRAGSSRRWRIQRRIPAASIDLNVRAERMGWLPCAPQLAANPLEVAKDAAGRRGAERLRGEAASRTARCGWPAKTRTTR